MCISALIREGGNYNSMCFVHDFSEGVIIIRKYFDHNCCTSDFFEITSYSALFADLPDETGQPDTFLESDGKCRPCFLGRTPRLG